MLVHVDTESWQSEINLITLLSETENNLQETEKFFFFTDCSDG